MSSRGKYRPRGGGSHHHTSFLFDNLFKENSNRPSAARSAATVGKWGITSFTSIRTINGISRSENEKFGSSGPSPSSLSSSANQLHHEQQNQTPDGEHIGPPKPKKFFKSRNTGSTDTPELSSSSPLNNTASTTTTTSTVTYNNGSSKRNYRPAPIEFNPGTFGDTTLPVLPMGASASEKIKSAVGGHKKLNSRQQKLAEQHSVAGKAEKSSNKAGGTSGNVDRAGGGASPHNTTTASATTTITTRRFFTRSQSHSPDKSASTTLAVGGGTVASGSVATATIESGSNSTNITTAGTTTCGTTSSASVSSKPPIVLRICRGKSQLLNDSSDESESTLTTPTPSGGGGGPIGGCTSATGANNITSSPSHATTTTTTVSSSHGGTVTSPRTSKDNSTTAAHQQQRSTNCRITRSARRSMQQDHPPGSTSPAAADTPAEFSLFTSPKPDHHQHHQNTLTNPALSPHQQYIPAMEKTESERHKVVNDKVPKPNTPELAPEENNHRLKQRDLAIEEEKLGKKDAESHKETEANTNKPPTNSSTTTTTTTTTTGSTSSSRTAERNFPRSCKNRTTANSKEEHKSHAAMLADNSEKEPEKSLAQLLEPSPEAANSSKKADLNNRVAGKHQDSNDDGSDDNNSEIDEEEDEDDDSSQDHAMEIDNLKITSSQDLAPSQDPQRPQVMSLKIRISNRSNSSSSTTNNNEPQVLTVERMDCSTEEPSYHHQQQQAVAMELDSPMDQQNNAVAGKPSTKNDVSLLATAETMETTDSRQSLIDILEGDEDDRDEDNNNDEEDEENEDDDEEDDDDRPLIYTKIKKQKRAPSSIEEEWDSTDSDSNSTAPEMEIKSNTVLENSGQPTTKLVIHISKNSQGVSSSCTISEKQSQSCTAVSASSSSSLEDNNTGVKTRRNHHANNSNNNNNNNSNHSGSPKQSAEASSNKNSSSNNNNNNDNSNSGNSGSSNNNSNNSNPSSTGSGSSMNAPPVKLLISKKKGSIFKSRALINDTDSEGSGTKKRRALYRHKWSSSDTEKDQQANRSSKAGSLLDDGSAVLSADDPMLMSEENLRKSFEDEFGFNDDPLTRVTKNKKEQLTAAEEESEEVTSIKCTKNDKGYYTVVRNVKKAHQIQEIGEFQEFNDDVEYILDALQDNNPISTRCLSAITLAGKCMVPAFRMHVRAHGTVAKFFKALHDATKDQSLGLCTATVMFVLSQDRLNMDLDRDCLELMLNLLESDVSYQQALDVCGLSSAQLEKNKQKVRELCAEIQSQGHAMHLNLDNITVGQLAMETLLSLTSKRAGEWFKEELRELGGLEHIMKTICECCRQVSDYVVSWTDVLLDKLRKVDRCLRVLENVTHNNEENQTYLLKYNDGVILDTLVKLYKLCDGEIPLYPVTDITDKESTGTVIREALLVTLKVLINLTHHFNKQSIGSSLIGSRPGVIETSLHLLLQVPLYIPEQKKFELGVLVLMLLINLIQDNATNKKLLMDAKAPSKLESIYSREESAVEALIAQFYLWENCAKIAEKRTNAILDGEKDETSAKVAYKSNEEFIEETVAKLLQKAGTHMEYTFLASYIVMLTGFLIMENAEYQNNVRQFLRGNNFADMVELLKKFFNFMNLTASTEASSVCAIKATEKVIKFLEECDAPPPPELLPPPPAEVQPLTSSSLLLLPPTHHRLLLQQPPSSFNSQQMLSSPSSSSGTSTGAEILNVPQPSASSTIFNSLSSSYPHQQQQEDQEQYSSSECMDLSFNNTSMQAH